jgi:hypothetical protein
MPLRSALLLFLAMLIPVARADEQRDLAKQKLAQELLKALLEDDDDDEEDKPKKPKAPATPKGEAAAQPAGKKSKKEEANKTFEPAADAEFSFEPYSELGKDFYPSVILSTATIEVDEESDDPSDATVYGDKAGSVGVLLKNVRKGDRFVVEVSADAGIRASKVSFTIKDSEVLVVAMPKLRYDFDLLSRNRQSRPVNVTFKVTRNDKPLDEVDQTWTLRQINDCPLVGLVGQPKKNGKIVGQVVPEMMFVFAAYVNENHPWVDQVLKDAKATGLSSSFGGYQGNEKDVLDQANAIWVALQRRGITYSSITDTTQGKQVRAQHVRFLDESIVSTQANCVDGSVLFASVLKKIGINAYLVLVPGHCYLAFSLDEKGAQLIGVETTAIGSGASLAQAIQAGSTNPENGLHPNLKRFNGADPQWQLIDLNAAREAGITPLPYVK